MQNLDTHITGDLILEADWLDDLNIMNNTTESIKIIESLADETNLNKLLATSITDILNHFEIDEQQLKVSSNYVPDKLIKEKEEEQNDAEIIDNRRELNGIR